MRLAQTRMLALMREPRPTVVTALSKRERSVIAAMERFQFR